MAFGIKTLLQKLGLVKKPPPPPAAEKVIEIACCSDQVHIAYRGLADDRMYVVYDRTWQEVKFYRANGLRVFCAQCRHRVL